MANPTFVAASSSLLGSSGTSIGITSPSTTAIGDLLLVAFTTFCSGTYAPTPSLPAGWANVQSKVNTGGGFTDLTYVASYVATAGGAQNFTFGANSIGTSSTGVDAVMVCVSGQNASTPIDGSALVEVASGNTITSPSVTATVANDLLFAFYFDLGNTSSAPSNPTGLTSAVALGDSYNGTGIRGSYVALTSSGASPTYTSTAADTVAPGVFLLGATVLVKGASGGGTTYNQSVSGTVTPTGTTTLAVRVVMALAGSLTLTAALAKRTSISLTGAVTAAGAIAKRAGKSLVGSVTGSGSLKRSTSTTFSGSTTPTGALSESAVLQKAVSGAITLSTTIATVLIHGGGAAKRAMTQIALFLGIRL